MVYATQIEVQGYLPPGYAIATPPAPTVAQVAQYLLDTSNEIDAAIASLGLAVPITAPVWFVNECVRLNAMGAAAQCLLLIFPLQPGQPQGGYNSGSMSAGAVFYRRYDQRLSEIRKGLGVPVGAAVAEADRAPRSYVTDANAITSPDGSAVDAWGRSVFSEPVLRMDRIY